MPRIYVNRNASNNIDSLDYVKNRLKKLDELVKEFESISNAAIGPVKIFGKRTSCFCCYKKLFHDNKQMGIVLKRAFKGDHIWIPPIEKQIE